MVVKVDCHRLQNGVAAHSFEGNAKVCSCGGEDWFGNKLQPAPTKTAIVIDLVRLRELMADFVLEVSPDDPTAYSIPFETFLRWLQRKQQEKQ